MIMMFLTVLAGAPPAADSGNVILKTRHVVWTIAPDGRNVSFRDRKTGRDWLNASAGSVAFFARVGSETRLPASVRRIENRIQVRFQGEGVTARLKIQETPDAVVMEVEEATDTIEELTFGQVILTLKGDAGEPIAVCSLARNVVTNVPELPGASSILRAIAYRRLGCRGASAAFVTAPPSKLRDALKRVVLQSPMLPHSPIGGPWALDSPANRRSYLFNFGGLNVASAKPWIDLAHALGAGQIDFHGGVSFRFGDFQPNPQTYPNGFADLRATVDALHAAGLQAGLHTYSFFIAKDSRYVTPVPDTRLATARSFTLAEPLDASADTIVVRESTAGVHATTGFFVNNSATLRIGQELVQFREASQTPPWRFTGCIRGALGTKPSAHTAGEPVHQLKELFGLFAPDPDSGLFLEIVENTARTYNECGFDMIYLDALDGSYILAGPEWAWHYGTRFVYELVQRLKKPAILEMSTFHHHLWCVRARMGAWDAPHTGYKEFVDMHRVVNRDCDRMYLPSHLGWWGVFPWNGIQPDRTLPDDLEYLLCKSLADDAGLSFVQGFSPDTFPRSPGAQRYARIIHEYEKLRRDRAVPAWLRKRLGEPKAEYTLVPGPRGKRAFVPVRYEKHDITGHQATLRSGNTYAAQPLLVRIEAKLAVAGGDAGPPLLAAEHIGALQPVHTADGVVLRADTVREDGAADGPRGDVIRLTASSSRKERRGAWAMVERVLPQPVDMTRKGLGVWIHGDGKGEVLNFQLRNAENVSPAVAEHYVVVDFTGWRYVELVEPESDRLSAYAWPYAAHRSEWEKNPGLAFTSAYKTYHPWLNYSAVAALSVWMNEIPPGETVECRLGPVVPIPLATGQVSHPVIAVNGVSVEVPVDPETGQYLEWDADGVVTLYGPQNDAIRTLKLPGRLPILPRGDSEVRFACRPGPGPAPRVRLTIIQKGEPLKF